MTGDEVDSPPETAVDEHISESRLAATNPSSDEAAHLARCVMCRHRRTELLAFLGPDDPAPELPRSARLAPGSCFGRYMIEGVLGEGGIAVVYRARHTELGSLHAIKVLSGPSRQVRERMTTEGRIQARIRSRNIVAVTDVIDVDGAPGLVMELVEGPSLAEHLEGRRRLPLGEVDELVRGILTGVAAAHRAGLIHRDLKPGNILLSPTAEGLVPKIADFGLAKVLDVLGEWAAHHTGTNTMLGTALYMSPEQIRATGEVDQRSDLFALGAILYELVTGTRAFAAGDRMAIFTAITDGRYRPVRELAPDTPERMVAAIEAALTVDLDRRVGSVEALAGLWGVSLPASDGSGHASRPPPTTGARPRKTMPWPPVLLLAPLFAVAAGAALLLNWPESRKRVVCMDATAERSVYDAEVYQRGATNADVLNDLLRDLPIDIDKETLPSTWNREDHLLALRPDLVVIHRSAFFHALNLEFALGYPDATTGIFPEPSFAPRWALLYRTADDKLIAMLGLVGTVLPDTRFLVYSRGSGDKEWPNEDHRQAWAADIERRFPALAGDVYTMEIAGGVKAGSFGNPVVAEDVRRRVKAILGIDGPVRTPAEVGF